MMRTIPVLFVAVLLLAILGFSGCGKSSRAEMPRLESQANVVVFGPHEFKKGTYRGALKAFGEDCSEWGGHECGSGVCLRAQKSGQERYSCSSPCSGAAECPAGWECMGLASSASKKFCFERRPQMQ